MSWHSVYVKTRLFVVDQQENLKQGFTPSPGLVTLCLYLKSLDDIWCLYVRDRNIGHPGGTRTDSAGVDQLIQLGRSTYRKQFDATVLQVADPAL